MSAVMTPSEVDQRLSLELDLDRIRRTLVAAAGRSDRAAAPNGSSAPSPAVDRICLAFGLDEFERSVLLMCAGFELDSQLGSLCSDAMAGGPPYPTFGLAAAIFSDSRPDAFLPSAPLRRWRLLELSSGSSLTTCPVHIDERILTHLLGSDQVDSRLAGIVRVVAPARARFPTQATLGLQVAEAWQRSWEDPALPTIHVSCADGELVRSVTADAAERLGLSMLVADAETLPSDPRELEGLARLWWREGEMDQRLLVLDCRQVDCADPMRAASIRRLIQAIDSPVLVETTTQQPLDGRKHLFFRVPPLAAEEQRQLWLSELDSDFEILDEHLDRVVSQYRLPAAEIASVAAEAKARMAGAGETAEIGSELWAACRSHVRPRLGGLAQRVEPQARWEDLVLPPPQLAILRLLATQVSQRFVVHERWGFGRSLSRGLGLASLFVGPSGTGKTMAAEVLAAELGLDLYRIDLSQVVNKYIGETEKNLARVFDAADSGAGILLFDEADALFGKRSEVRDSHDRHANIETGYLLQRMEGYRGLAVLTTNMKEALDPAFLRRLRFFVEFPFPDATLRAGIWRRIFPPATPLSNIDVDRLAQLNVSGGSIKNIAINAAFLAAGEGAPVSMQHLLVAARLESVKLQRPITNVEVRGWS